MPDTTPEDAEREAIRRIRAWRPGEVLNLSIPGLEAIPAEIGELDGLETLDCSFTSVSDLGLLSGLSGLKWLKCSGTPVSDLDPLSELPALMTLDFSGSSVNDLRPLSGIPSIKVLEFSNTSVAELMPISRIPILEKINCSITPVIDLEPLSNLRNLAILDCSFTPIGDLRPISHLKMKSLSIDFCHIIFAPEGFWEKSSFEDVSTYHGFLPDLPSEALSKALFENCLPRIRAHLADVRNGAERMADSKVMVLGNGRVGKTQFCRRLRGEDYDPAVPSTHGITVGSAPVPAPAPGGEAAEGRLHLWDFGGQDIYHGTHALFLRSRAIFAILWTPEMERNETHAHDGMTFRNYPLAYWLDYVERFGGRESPVLVVQAQCESARAEEDLSDDTRERLARFPLRKVLTHSARTGRGEAALWEAIAEFHGELDKPAIGRVRARVKARLEALRDADAAEPDPARRRHRTLPFADFEAMCAEEGGVADTRLFLDFLHNAGTVFHRPGLFGDRLILDQGWALEAIYAVFHRQACYRVLEQAGGRFTRSLLGLLLWDEGGYSVEEQELFISLMESCGVCFRLRPGDDARNIEAEYIAPDLLPETRPAQAAREWDEAEPTLGARMSYDLLPPSLMRGIIARIGRIAGLAADYWRTGVYLYERRHRSRGLVEVAMDPRTMDEGARDEGAWSGTITLRTQGGRHDKLADALYEIVTEESERLGLHDWSMRFINTERERDADGAEARRPRRARARPEGEATGPTLEVSRERSPAPQWFVSYAWADNTEETGRPVDRLCAEAERRGRTIRRDNRELGPGDSIEAFMQALGAGDRIFVFLSQAYLRSPACMFELHEIWRHAGEDGAAFLDRVRIHLGADAALGDRVGHANHWLDKKDELEALIRRNPAIATGAAGRDYEKIRRFADKTYDILALVAGHIQPRTLEELSEHGLDDA